MLAARDGSAEVAHAALDVLCSAYWYPIYAFVRRHGDAPQEAHDLTQEFFTRLLARDFLVDVDPSRGRFRSFLLAACRHFLANERDHRLAQKRGGGRVPLALDAITAEERYRREPADLATPEHLYARRFALTLLERTLTNLEAELRQRDDGIAHLLLPFLNGDERAESYQSVAAAAGCTEGALRVRVHRLRRRYGELLRAELAEIVDRPEEIDDELAALFDAVAAP